MEVIKGNLTMVGLNTLEPKVFWNGQSLENIVDIATNWDQEEPRVKIRVSVATSLSEEMKLAGINIKVGEAK